MQRLIAVSICAVVGAFVFATAAAASPSNAKNAAQVMLTNCTDGNTYQVVVNGNGTFSPGHVVGSNSIFVPTTLALNFVFFDASTGQTQTMSQDAAKKSPVKNPVSCDIPLQTLFSAPDGSFGTIEGSVTGFTTPQG
jgi:hypothetical protein